MAEIVEATLRQTGALQMAVELLRDRSPIERLSPDTTSQYRSRRGLGRDIASRRVAYLKRLSRSTFDHPYAERERYLLAYGGLSIATSNRESPIGLGRLSSLANSTGPMSPSTEVAGSHDKPKLMPWNRPIRRLKAMPTRPRLVTTMIWAFSFLAATEIWVFHPVARLADHLDPAAILTVAGLSLVAVSVTFGVVALQTQHLTETYPRAIAGSLARSQQWPLILAAQACGVVYVVVIALFAPTAAAGVAAALLLAVGMIESGLVLDELLSMFDPVRLIKLQAANAIGKMKGSPADKVQFVAQVEAQPILDLMVNAAEKGDADVVREGLVGWQTILEYCVNLQEPSWVLVGWIFDRARELATSYASRHIGIILPATVPGISRLGVLTAKGRHLVARELSSAVLRDIAFRAGDANLPYWSDMAIGGVGAISSIYLDKKNYYALGEIVAVLRPTGREVSLKNRSYLATAGDTLAAIVLRLITEYSREDFTPMMAGDAVKGIAEIAAMSGPQAQDRTVEGLVWETSETNIPRLCSALINIDRGEGAFREVWMSLCAALADICFGLGSRDDAGPSVRSQAAVGCRDTLLALFGSWPAVQRNALHLVERLFDKYVELALADQTHLQFQPRDLSTILLGAYLYWPSRRVNGSDEFRASIASAVRAIGAISSTQRFEFVPGLRALGAAAVFQGDIDMATLIAEASLPSTVESIDRQARDWRGSDLSPDTNVYPESIRRDEYLDTEALRRFRDMELGARPFAGESSPTGIGPVKEATESIGLAQRVLDDARAAVEASRKGLQESTQMAIVARQLASETQRLAASHPPGPAVTDKTDS